MLRSDVNNWQAVHVDDLATIGLPSGSNDQLIIQGINSELNTPFRIHASFPTPDTKLVIGSSLVIKGDGSAQVVPPTDDTIRTFPETTIDYITGVVSPSGNVWVDGGPLILPTGTAGYFVIHAFSYVSVDNKVDSTFSLESALLVNLQDPGVVFANLGGTPIGYVILQCITGRTYKSANALTGKILNSSDGLPCIFRFGSGSGGGGGGGGGGGVGSDMSFRLQSVTSGGVLTIKKGDMALTDGRELMSIPDFEKDISSYTVNGDYYCYIDLETLAPTPTSQDGRLYYPIAAANIILSLNTPEDVSQMRYVPLGVVRRISGAWQDPSSYSAKSHNIASYMMKVTLPSGEVAQILIAGKSRTISAVAEDFDVPQLFPMAHNLEDGSPIGNIPLLVFQVEQTPASGNYVTVNSESFFSVSSTHINMDTPVSTIYPGANIRLTFSVGQWITKGSGIWNTLTLLDGSAVYAMAFDEVVVSTTEGMREVYLPGTPELGDRVRLVDYGSTWSGSGSRHLRVYGNSKTLGGLISASVDFTVPQSQVELVYNGSFWTYSIGSSGSGATGSAYLANLADVYVVGVTGGQSLMYSLGAERWEAYTPPVQLALGITGGNAYRGDYGNTAYLHSQSSHAPTGAEANWAGVTGLEKIAGTSTSYRSFSPKDVAEMGYAFGGIGRLEAFHGGRLLARNISETVYGMTGATGYPITDIAYSPKYKKFIGVSNSIPQAAYSLPGNSWNSKSSWGYTGSFTAGATGASANNRIVWIPDCPNNQTAPTGPTGMFFALPNDLGSGRVFHSATGDLTSPWSATGGTGPTGGFTTPFTSGGVKDIVYANGYLVAISSNSHAVSRSIMSGGTPTSWGVCGAGATGAVGSNYKNSLAFSSTINPGAGMMVAVGYQCIWYSNDGGYAWVNVSGTIDLNGVTLNTVRWCSTLGLFVAGGSNTRIYYSPDGINWSFVLTGPVNAQYKLEWFVEFGMIVLFPLTGSTTYYISNNLTDWAEITTTSSVGEFSPLCCALSLEYSRFIFGGVGVTGASHIFRSV